MKHIESEKKLTVLTNNVAQISEKGYDFLGILKVAMVVRIF